MSKFPTQGDQGDEIRFEKEIEINGGPVNFSYEDEMRSLRRESEIEKLHRRITLLSILLPCLLSAILFFAYSKMKYRLNQVQDMRATEVKALSQDVAGRATSLEKSFVSIMEELKRDKRAIEKLSGSKVDKKGLEKVEKQSAELANMLAGLQKDWAKQKESLARLVKDQKRQAAKSNKTLKALANELNEEKQAIENLSRTLKKEVTGIVQAIERVTKDAHKQDSAIKDLSEHKEELDNILENKWSGYQTTISLLQKEIGSIEEEVLRLQRQVNMALRNNTDTLTLEPDKIIEQEITE
ncbi:MAG: hypothetical protein KAV83_07355 [Desulfobacterales bacterium]|nr:hypothetical protein [Desulfobacterales bacterium]